MDAIYYIGLDVHKKTIAYCIKTVGGKPVRQGVVSVERNELRQWLADLPGPWMGAMEATLFTGWIYNNKQVNPRQSRGFTCLLLSKPHGAGISERPRP